MVIGGAGGDPGGGISKNYPSYLKSSINRPYPLFEWIALLPYFGVRAVYRKYSGYIPPEVHEQAAGGAALKEAVTSLCPGSGKTADDTAGSTTCPNCGREVTITGGKILTHEA